MVTYIKVNNTEYPAIITGEHKDRTWGEREVKNIRLTMTATDAAALLPDNTPWSIIQRDTVPKYDSDSQPTGETEEVVNEWDNSAYSLSGAITDHRDGTVTVKLGKPTESELSAATVNGAGRSSIARAGEARPMIEQASASLSDGEAAKSPELFPRWADHIGETVSPAHPPSDMDESGVLHISRRTKVRATPRKRTGRRTPPLPCGRSSTSTTRARRMTRFRPLVVWSTPMSLSYKDPEDTKLYLCERIGEQSGNKITLQYLPHELVGQYFAEV